MSGPPRSGAPVQPLFVDGPIDPDAISRLLAPHVRPDGVVGGHEIFLGRVRADMTEDGSRVTAIEFSAHSSMALDEMDRIRQEVMDAHGLAALDVRHSLGVVPTGGICLLVMATAGHRAPARAGCAAAVEGIKARLPIFGREELDTERHRWKENRP